LTVQTKLTKNFYIRNTVYSNKTYKVRNKINYNYRIKKVSFRLRLN